MSSRGTFWSHDGFGLGHARRNGLIAAAILEHEPTAGSCTQDQAE